MGEPAYVTTYTVAEYLEIEATSEIKHEYHDGEIFAMAGGTPRHSLAVSNTNVSLGIALKGRKCRVYNSDLQVTVNRSRYVYPDLTVVCGKPQHYATINPNAVANPVLIVEVLSPDTEQYDRGTKFFRYRQIESFREYVLISQQQTLVEVFYKNNQNVWELTTFANLTDEIPLRSIDVTILMSDIYDGLDLPNPLEED